MNFRIITLTILLASASVVNAETVTHFSATLSSGSVIAGGVAGTSSSGTGTATFTLTEPNVGTPTLSYDITLDSADLDGAQTTSLDDNVVGIHLHDTSVCFASTCIAGDTRGTAHALNIFGAPRTDDTDMTFDVSAGTVSGLWDDSDENSLTPAPSGKPSDFLLKLLAGKMFLMIHTQTVPSGAYGGFIQVVPEPASVVLFATAGLLSLLGLRRHR